MYLNKSYKKQRIAPIEVNKAKLYRNASEEEIKELFALYREGSALVESNWAVTHFEDSDDNIETAAKIFAKYRILAAKIINRENT